jgi:hypothetical protein
MVRVHQRAYLKCLQISTLLLPICQTRGHKTDTSAVRATHRDVWRRLATRSSRRAESTSIGKTPAKG